jgi:hypothetical protein
LEAPVGYILATVWPEKTEADAMEGFVNPHMPGRRGCMVGGEDIASKGGGDDDEHEQFSIVLNRLENNQFAVNKGEAVATDIVAVGRMQG